MVDMASLLSKPNAQPVPAADMDNGQQQAFSLASLMGMKPNQQGQQQPGAPQPSYEQTVAAIRHMGAFQRGWQQILETPNIGKADVRGPFVEMMADLMGEGFITLPQSMTLMKTFPSDPLQQRKWVEEHLQRDEQASVMILQHYAAAAQGDPMQQAQMAMQQTRRPMTGHSKMIGDLTEHYKSRQRKKS